jgi:cytochrome P450
MTMSTSAPSSDVDFVSDELAFDPYPTYTRLREMGSVVWLEKMSSFAVVTDKEIREALEQPVVFSSAKGVTQSATINEMTGGRSTIASDPPLHQSVRGVLGQPLRPRRLKEIAPRIQAESDALIDALVTRGSFDGVEDLAHFLPLSIVSHLVGLPEEGRENILGWATAFIHAAGGDNERARAAVPLMQNMFEWVGGNITPEKVSPTGWAGQMFEAEAQGEVPSGWAINLITDYIVPSLDTTISATSSLLLLLGQNPDQWDILKGDPTLIPSALGEALRLEPPLQAFSRVTSEDVTLGGVAIPADSRVILVYASANRDPARWDRPDEFDVTRPDATQHLGFGFGEHVCIGQSLAKLEITSLLEAMLKKVDRISVGEPQRKLVNGARLLEHLPLHFS